jgi:acyl carrier protein
MDEFRHELAEILEVDEVHASDVLTDFPEWDSLSVLSAIVMIHEKYGVTLGAADIRNVGTVQSLYDLIGR